MKKSFKKAVAVLLAVLMVVFSVPFTALAAPGDYNPDVQLQFGTFHKDDGATGWQDYSVASAADTFELCAMYDVPLDYDAKAGTLTMSAAKAAKADEVVGFGAPSEDYVYGVGDYFTATVRLDNIDKIHVFMGGIKYSDNIEPAGVYSYKNGRKTAYAMGTADECAAANEGTFTVGGTAPVQKLSCSEIYGLNIAAGTNMDQSKIVAEDNIISCQVANAAGLEYVDVSETYNEYYADPETGDLNGYTYTNCALLETFVFKITGEGPITFEVADPDDTIAGQYQYGAYIACRSDGSMVYNYTTYAPSYGLKTTGSTNPADGPENPGSRHMTFFGTNIHNGAVEPEEHTHTYNSVTTDPDCTQDGYITFTCNNKDGLGTVGDDVYTEGVDKHPELTKLGHDYQIISETDSDCQTKGEIVYECTRCGDTYTDYKELSTTHTPVLDDSTAVAATCKTDGKEADTVCAVCGTLISEGAVIPATGHNFDTNGDGVVDEEDGVVTTEAKCEEDGVRTYTCTRNCGEEGYTYTEVIHATGHTPGEPVETIIKEPTCTEKGYKNTTVTCTECDKELSSVDEELEELHHDFVEGETVAPTPSEDGYTVYTCSRCGEIEKRDFVPALGINVTVLASALGTATVNGTDVTTENVTVNVAGKSDVVLTATAASGAKFIGWNVDGKLVSTEANITVKALANVTYEPVFQAVAETFTVVFTDKFGNVYDTQTVASGAEITVPEAPVIAGYNFVGWSMTDEEIAALDAAATINAKYERIAEATYTVTADGCTISTPYATTQDVNAGIGYDTLVTVTAPGATAWKINGATVAYGESYSFYVGADVTITVVKDSVTATPTVAAVSVSEIGTTGKLRASFLATRSMTADTTFVNAGFVYAINPAADTITLADVNGSTVLAGYCATDSEQFCLNVGRISQTGRIVARAFLAYVDGEGVTQVVYAEPQAYTYA